MRKYIYSIIALLMVTLCSAQLYVSQAEYFWDNDPGTGNGTPVLATDGNLNSAFEYLTKTGISTPGNGLHKFCLRVKDNTGVWGPVFTSIINVQQNNTSTIMAVSQAEYFWDTDPGTGNGTPVLATDGNFDSTYEQLTKTGINLPSAGLHVFNIRVKDNSGASNQKRTDLVEFIDSWFLKKFENITPKPDAKINTETIAWAVDRLSILALKVYHMSQEAYRESASEEHRAACKAKLDVLLTQHEDLSTSINQLLTDIENGDVKMKVYKQMKMYNDESLNPILYQKGQQK